MRSGSVRRSSILTYSDKFNVMIVGDDNVGKTSILERFDKRIFNEGRKSSRNIEDFSREFKYEGKLYLFKLWDTLSQEKYSRISKAFYQKADGIMIVTASNNRESYLNINKWIKQISDNVDIKNTPLVLICNKIDLKGERQVGLDEIRQIAEDLGINYYETSAKKNFGIDEAFNELFKKIVNKVYRINVDSVVIEQMELEQEKDDTSSKSLKGCFMF